MNETEKKENRKLFFFINCLMIGYIIIRVLQRIIIACHELKQCGESWGVTEYMVNYQGGFVRRGLLGEIIYQFSLLTSQIDPRWYMVLISGVSLCWVVWFLIKKHREHDLCWWILPLNVCLMGAYDLVRKDFLCAALVILILRVYSRLSNPWYRCGIVVLLLAFTLNIHECTFFMVVPFLLLSLYRDKSISVICKGIGITTPILIMAAIAYHKGDMEVAEKIWDSWKGILPIINDKQPLATIASIGWDAKAAMEYHINCNFLTQSLFVYGWYSKPLVWCAVVFVAINILFLRRQSETLSISPEVHRMLSIMIFQFIALLPMFTVLSCDGARVCFYWMISTMAIYFCIPPQQIAWVFPSFYQNAVRRLQNFLTIGKSRKIAIYAVLFLAISQNYTSIASTFFSSVVGTYVYAVNMAIEKLNLF